MTATVLFLLGLVLGAIMGYAAAIVTGRTMASRYNNRDDEGLYPYDDPTWRNPEDYR